MPLSEHEQRVLEQMEQALYAEDPRLASQLKSTAQGASVDRRRIALGVVIAIAGLGLVLVGVMSQQILVGALGFLAMVFGGAWAATPARRGRAALGVVHQDGTVHGARTGAAPRPKAKGPRKPKASGTFMQRMEQQWDKRREEGPF